MSAEATEKRKLILIVEDVESTREVIELSLRDLGTDFRHAGNGLEGLRLAAELLPDLIVLDLALPKVKGDEVLRVLRTDPVTKEVPVLVVTAHGQSGMARTVIDMGADAFMEKPFLPVELLAAAHELLKRRTG